MYRLILLLNLLRMITGGFHNVKILKLGAMRALACIMKTLKI